MVHAIMASNMNIAEMPGWFLEGTAEFIPGADERVVNEIGIIDNQSNFNVLFKTTVGSPTTNAGYAVSYIAVKLLDQDIRDSGGVGIKELFQELQTGKTLDQALTAVSLAHNGMNGHWNNLASFEAYFRAVGFTSMDALLNLSNADTGSIAGSDYGHAALDASSVLSNAHIGASRNFTIVIPDEYINSVGVHNEIESIKFSDGIVWNAAEIQQAVIRGNLIGTDGDDVITGTDGNDNLRGYKGNDHLSGGLGNDVYFYALGDGNDFIADTVGVNELQLSGTAGNQVKTTRDGSNNLVFTFVDGGTVTIADAFDAYGRLKADRIKTVKFEDGSVWYLTRIREESLRVQGSILNAPERGNFSGTNNDDTLVAGINNKLYGGYGNDTYVINAGGEQYIIQDNGANTLQFGAGITKDQLRFTRESYGTDLLISLNGQNYVLVKYMFARIDTTVPYANTPGIEYIRFENGDQLSLRDIKRELLLPTDGDDNLYGYETNDLLVGQAGDDSLYGLSGDDMLSGGSGNDYLRGGDGNDVLDAGPGGYDRSLGGAGDDTFIYNRGDGYTVIDDESGVDTLLLSEGITREQIIFSGEYGVGFSSDDYAYRLNVQFDEFNVIEINGLFAFNKADPLIVERSSIDVIRFANNDELNLTDLRNIILTPTGGDDYLTGFITNESFRGGAGNDVIFDPMGNEQYFYELGDGDDIVEDEEGNDILVFGEGIFRTDLSFYRESTDLIVSLDNGGSIRIAAVFYSGTPESIISDFVIESIE
jgi:Ca2+-binding RTX toxin-like protein